MTSSPCVTMTRRSMSAPWAQHTGSVDGRPTGALARRRCSRLPPASCIGYQVGIDDLRVNDLPNAFDSFNRAIDQHCFNMTLIRVDPLLDPVRGDPRYIALLRRIHQ